MAVRQQDARQPFEADARLQNLSLRALSAIHEKTILVMTDDLRRQPALGRGSRGGGAEEKNFEQDDSLYISREFHEFSRMNPKKFVKFANKPEE